MKHCKAGAIIVSRETTLLYIFPMLRYNMPHERGSFPVPIWTSAQQQAIQARNKTILVSAAAGSGKTAVLVERILDLIRTDHMDVDRMLIVTFTRAAAAEMRERILKALNEAADVDETLREQVPKLDRAVIGTLHSFCGQVIREHFQLADIDPLARLCEGGERDALYRQAMNETLQMAYEEKKINFTRLADAFEDDDILQMMDELYVFLFSLPDPWRWLHRQMANFPDEASLKNHPWAQTVLHDVHLQLQGIADLIQVLKEMMDLPDAAVAYGASLVSDEELLQNLLDAASDGMEALGGALDAAEFERLGTVRKKTIETAAWCESYQEKRNQLKKNIRSIKEQVPRSFTGLASDMERTSPCLRALGRLVRQLHKRFQIIKRERGVYDYQDLEHKTLAVLKEPEAREAVQSRFDAVFVDECQDNSGIQEAIIQEIHGSSGLFLVGDVKQSIYRFRLADPTLFLQKYRTYGFDPASLSRKIVLRENFRSASTVLQAVNQVFESVMREDVTEISYDQEAHLIPGREPQGECPVAFYVLDPENAQESTSVGEEMPEEIEEVEELSKVEREACIVAENIHRLVEESFVDKETKTRRLYCYRDMAILLPKAKNMAYKVAQTLQKAGVPVYSEADEQYFDLPEITAMMSLLQVLDNPLQDLPLLSTLRLPCFSMEEEELAAIRLKNADRNIPFHQAFFACIKAGGEAGNRCALIAEKLEEWRFLARVMPLSKLLWQLVLDTGLYMRAGALPAGESRQANLRLLCERGAAYESAQNEGLHGFLGYGENLRLSGDKTTAKILGETENVVRIMTIHKSKGLEFPAVFVLGLGNGLYEGGRPSKISLHRELGWALPYINPEDRIMRKTFSQQAIALKIRAEERAERARLLYVAMTRARERLFMIGTVRRKSQVQKWQTPPGSYRIWQAGSMLDWVAQTVYAMPEGRPLRERFEAQKEENETEQNRKSTESTGFPQAGNPWNIKVFADSGSRAMEKQKTIHSLVETLKERMFQPVEDQVAADLSAELSDIAALPPLKTSVTSLCKQQLLPGYLLGHEEETPQEKGKLEELMQPLRLSPLPSKPAFLMPGDLSGADRGSATHKALGYLVLSGMKGKNGEELHHKIQEELNALLLQGILTKSQRDSLYEEWIQAFYESEWGQRLLSCDKYHREWAFNLQLYQAPLTLVQGVIDCCFIEDDAWVLIDYKTDTVKDEEAILTRYTPQLNLYRQALEKITSRPVKETVLYLLRYGKGLNIPLKTVERN